MELDVSCIANSKFRRENKKVSEVMMELLADPPLIFSMIGSTELREKAGKDDIDGSSLIL